jgi:hypothetical protein
MENIVRDKLARYISIFCSNYSKFVLQGEWEKKLARVR